jgi:hypothetical protein
MHMPSETVLNQTHVAEPPASRPTQPLETKAERIARARALIATVQSGPLPRPLTLVPSQSAPVATRATRATTLQRDRRGA